MFIKQSKYGGNNSDEDNVGEGNNTQVLAIRGRWRIYIYNNYWRRGE